MDNFGTQENATSKYVGEPRQTYLGPTTLSSPNSLPPNSRIRHFRMGLASFSSKFTVCSPLLVSPLRRRQKMRSDPQLPLLPTEWRESERLSAAPATVANSDYRRLTFGSYATAARRRLSERASLGLGVETKRTENGIRVWNCGWREGRCE